MKSLTAIIVLALICFSCNSKNIENTENGNLDGNRLIPEEEYIVLPEDCAKKLLSSELITQMSVKNYLFKHGEISESELSQKVIMYLEVIPTTEQKTILQNESVVCDWENWTPPADNHPYGFITASIPTNNFENIICLEFIKKMDTAEREIDPDYLEKLGNIN